jgi:hypothetical protein
MVSFRAAGRGLSRYSRKRPAIGSGYFHGSHCASAGLAWRPARGGCYDRRMPKYVIERDVEGAGRLSADELREISLRSVRALGELGPRIQWIHSYVTDHKVYCVYLAPDEETIREHARRAGMPADRISVVRHLLDPINY